MNTDALQSIVKKLKEQGNMRFLAGASKAQLHMFEKTHEITLPKQFKEWLLFSDGGECFLPAGVQFLGVAHKPLIDVNDDDRPSDEYTVIGALASGDPILCQKSSERISIYNREAGRIESDETYPDFFSFVNDLYNLLGIGG